MNYEFITETVKAALLLDGREGNEVISDSYLAPIIKTERLHSSGEGNSCCLYTEMYISMYVLL